MKPTIYYGITDTHFRDKSNVRIGDYLPQLLNKLEYVIQEANKEDAVIIHGGDMFDVPAVDYATFWQVCNMIMQSKNPWWVIPGNHDILYHSMKLFGRTSINLLVKLGVVKLLEEPVDFGSHVLTPTYPTAIGKPQITLFHGFLNQQDGPYTFEYQNILTEDPYLALLGHDHVFYEDVEYRNGVIVRPGSFVRAIRLDTSMRIPNILRIEVDETGIKHSLKPIITATPFEIAFKPKPRKAEAVDFNDMLSNLTSFEDDKSFDSLLKASAPVHVVEYINSLLNKKKL